MRVMWQTDEWLRVRDIRQRLDYAPVGHTTVAKVAGILYQKGLLSRRLGDRGGRPGPPAWWYRAARPASEHIGALIAVLLDLSPDPDATLDYALRSAIASGQVWLASDATCVPVAVVGRRSSAPASAERAADARTGAGRGALMLASSLVALLGDVRVQLSKRAETSPSTSR